MKKILLLFLCIFITTQFMYGQCPVDAILAIDANCVGTSGGLNTGDPTGNDAIDVNPCNNNYAGGDDYIYEFTATTNDALELELTGTESWSGLMVTDACPDDPAANCIASATSISTTESLTTPSLIPGVTYYIHISTWPAPQSIGEFCLNATLVAPPMPPVNDDCADAIVLTPGTECLGTLGVDDNATASGETPDPTCGSYGSGDEGDTWFVFTVPVGTDLTDEFIIDTAPISGTTDFTMQVYSGACGSLVPIECDDDDGVGLMPSMTITGLSPGQVIYIRMFDFATNDGGTFEICVYEEVTLAVELVQMRATAMEEYNMIEWTTASEIDNDYFVIERSQNGVSDWRSIGQQVKGTNTSFSADYSLIDSDPLLLSYYRLKSIDFNGVIEYSDVTSVSRKQVLRFGIYPNPASDFIVLSSTEDGNIQVINRNGTTAFTSTILKGENRIEVFDLTPGVYYIKITSSDSSASEAKLEKFIKL